MEFIHKNYKTFLINKYLFLILSINSSVIFVNVSACVLVESNYKMCL